MAERVLGIDFGHVRIGLAISDPLKVIASPLENLLAKNTLEATVAALVAHLAHLKKEKGYRVNAVVVGLPLHMDGSESERSQIVRQFATLLEKALQLPVHLLDERLSSVQAERALMEGGFSRKKRAQVVDRVSAVILLQTFLNQTSRL